MDFSNSNSEKTFLNEGDLRDQSNKALKNWCGERIDVSTNARGQGENQFSSIIAQRLPEISVVQLKASTRVLLQGEKRPIAV